MRDTKSQTALVTGAGRRIGRAIALDLGRHGYQVAVHYNQSADDAADVVREITGAGGLAHSFHADLFDEVATQGLVPAVIKKMGSVDILVNNASIFEDEDWQQVTRASWDSHMNINLRAPFILMQQMALALPKDRNGSIVNIIDQRVLNLNPHFVGYTLAKAGLWTLTQTMAQAMAPHIRVNAIGPGPTLPSNRQEDADFKSQYENTPLQSQVDLTDICEAVRYLAAAKSVTGQMISVDGGEHLGWAQAESGYSPKE